MRKLFAIRMMIEISIFLIFAIVTLPFMFISVGPEAMINGYMNYLNKCIERFEKSGYYSEEELDKLRSIRDE